MSRLAATLCGAIILSISVAVGTAAARTPTPMPTPTATALLHATPRPTSTPRPPADQVAHFEGGVWLNAGLDSGHVIAVVGDQVCGEAQYVTIPCDPACYAVIYGLDVVSDRLKPGCGYEGAMITFLVGGVPASQTATWHAGSSQFLPLVAGPPFASIGGHFAGPEGLPILYAPYSEEKSVLIPYVGEVACGYDDYFWCDRQGGCAYSTVVYSDQQRPGCGYEGAPITFKLIDAQRNVIATATENGVWHAWNGYWPDQQELNLTFITPSGIRIGSVGTGDSQSGHGPPPAAIALSLAIAGAAASVGGAALRRRAIR